MVLCQYALKRINVSSPGLVNFPKLQWWNALLPESARACQHYFDSFLRLRTTQDVDIRKRTAQREMAACTRTGVKSVRTDRSSPVADRENVALAKITTFEAAVWAEAERTDELSE